MSTIEVEQLSDVERKITVQIPWEKVQEELDAAYSGLQRRARVKGFRPGKVPRKVLEQFYKQTVEGEVLGRLIDDGYRSAVDQHELFPIDQPNLEAFPKVNKGQPIEFIARVEVKPEISPQKVDGLSVTRKIRAIEDVEIEAELESLREKASIVEAITDRTHAEPEDLAIVDFFGFVNNESFKGGKGINYTIELGSKKMIPGFEEQIVGMQIGEEKTFRLRFPDGEGPDEAQGKDVDWKVELKELKKKTLPELDDEFAKDLGEFDTLDELKKSISDNLATREDARGQRALRNAAMEALVEANPFSVPDRMVDRQIEAMLNDTLRYISDKTDPRVTEAVEKLKVDARPSAAKQVAATLLLEGVARAEKLEVSEEEVEGRIQELAREHRMPVPQVRKQLAENNQLDSIQYNLLQDKALDLVISKANVTEVTVTKEELDDAESAPPDSEDSD
ncbi:MAG: trigger factor [Myxococcales bacterium]|nr:trigger factor [Myxococcales bacterium]